jgi:hypothetical protein
VKSLIIIAAVQAVELFVTQLAPAQGTLYVSNLGQTPTGSISIGSDSWIAQEFELGFSNDQNIYTMYAIQLLMDAASGNPNGFSVSIYRDPMNDLNDAPKQKVASLNGSINPSTAGIYTYTDSSGIAISPGTAYFVVVTAATPVSQGAYVWSASSGFTQTVNGYTISDDYYSSASGSSWTQTMREDVFQIGIYGTAVPEPSIISLFMLGSGVLIYVRRVFRRGVASIGTDD